jgi:CheY-like chemotaxis protein
MSDRYDSTNVPEEAVEDVTADLMTASSHSRGSKKSRKAAATAERPVEHAAQELAQEAAPEVAQEIAQESAPESRAILESTPHTGSSRAERRGRRRALISAPVRVRQSGSHGGVDEISTTLDVSRSGILFLSAKGAFTVGMDVAVTFPYSKSPVAAQAEQTGRVARINQMSDGRRTVAVALHAAYTEKADAHGGKEENSCWQTYAPESADKPLILAVDADGRLRDSLKNYLSNEGYEVIAVPGAREAHEVLDSHTPALVIAEIEGSDLPGYDLCAHVKATPRLRAVPVMLMTRSAYPSDYANAHSLGAVVCIAKPFRQERLGHVVRLLAPPPQSAQQGAPRQADPSRKPCAGNATKPLNAAKSLFRKSFRLSR